MKLFKKIAAIVLIAVMALTVCGCHKKNEIAVTIGDYEYTSAYYMCALINAYAEGQDEVYASLSEEEQQSDDVDYSKKKIGDKSFNEWVKDRAIEILKTVSYYKAESEKNDVKIEGENKQASEYYASMMWQNYEALFSPNGVSEKTFSKYFIEGAPSMMTDYVLAMYGIAPPNDYEELYFQYLYGKKGPKEIAIKDVKKELYNNYLVADIIEITFSEETNDEKTSIKKQFEEYEESLKNGKMTFEDVYKDYYEITDEEDLPESEAKDPYASIINEMSNNYDEIKKMDIDDIKLFIDDDAGTVSLVIKKDIKSDSYYLDYMDITLRHSLKDEEFSKASQEAIKKLEADINDYAVDRFEVEDIKFPQN